jgi:hypothetical protein
MIKQILTAAKSTLSQPISQPAAEPAKPIPSPTPEPSPAPKPEAILKSTPKTAKELAVETARQLGYELGDGCKLKIRRHQPAKNTRLLFCDVKTWPARATAWNQPVRCWVKDALSWLPANPPHDELEARFVGATVDGILEFESADQSRKSRYLKSK